MDSQYQKIPIFKGLVGPYLASHELAIRSLMAHWIWVDPHELQKSIRSAGTSIKPAAVSQEPPLINAIQIKLFLSIAGGTAKISQNSDDRYLSLQLVIAIAGQAIIPSETLSRKDLIQIVN
jgi:hypothetical protein